MCSSVPYVFQKNCLAFFTLESSYKCLKINTHVMSQVFWVCKICKALIGKLSSIIYPTIRTQH